MASLSTLERMGLRQARRTLHEAWVEAEHKVNAARDQGAINVMVVREVEAESYDALLTLVDEALEHRGAGMNVL